VRIKAMLKQLGRRWLPFPVRHFLRQRKARLVHAVRRVLAPTHPINYEALYYRECSEQLALLKYRPLISIVVPVYNTPLQVLHKMILSVEWQIYPNWELCIVDDCSPNEEVREFLRGRCERDPRMVLRFRGENGRVSACTNDGIRMATGDFVAFLDHDDELTPDALFHIVARLNEKPQADIVYTDHDKITEQGERHEPCYKPDWSPDYFRGVMYLCHLVVVRRSLLLASGGCDDRFNGMQDYELLLRLSERTDRVEHVARVLYHWRSIAGSVAADINAKKNIDALQELAVQEHLERVGIAARARRLGGHRVHLEPLARRRRPLVSILIPTRDRPELIGTCLRSIFEKTSYRPFEVIIGDNESSDPAALACFERYPVQRVPLAGAFHFSRFNNQMARSAKGEFLVLLNNDTEVLDPEWLDRLLLYAEQPDAGAVGPRLLYADGAVQHAGVILGPRGTADHVMRGFPAQVDGYAGSLRCTREVSAVTGACLMVRTEKYLACGGLNEFFRCHYEDVDFCLRLRRRHWRNLYVGSTTLIHHESKSRGPRYSYTDRVLLLDYWGPMIEAGDPYYNRNFETQSFDYTLKAAEVRLAL
jgi:O-antigen biosynthesis protein